MEFQTARFQCPDPRGVKDFSIWLEGPMFFDNRWVTGISINNLISSNGTSHPVWSYYRFARGVKSPMKQVIVGVNWSTPSFVPSRVGTSSLSLKTQFELILHFQFSTGSVLFSVHHRMRADQNTNVHNSAFIFTTVPKFKTSSDIQSTSQRRKLSKQDTKPHLPISGPQKCFVLTLQTESV